MNPVYIPASGLEDWRKLLAKPEKHWRENYSAMSVATAWHYANGFPAAIAEVFKEADQPFRSMVPLLMIPEHKVELAGRGNPSQNDVWVLASHDSGLASIAVEAKCAEGFGDPLWKWLKGASSGKRERLDFLCQTIGLVSEPPESIAYQLLHRTASAVIEAKRFRANTALMLVHSFNPENKGLIDFEAFVSLFGATAKPGELVRLSTVAGVALHTAWVRDMLPVRLPRDLLAEFSTPPADGR